MPKRATLRHRLVLAAIVAPLLLALMSIAQSQGERERMWGTSGRMHHSRGAHRELNGSTWRLYMIQHEMNRWTPKAERPFPDYPFHGYNGG